jgi:hypothetical protein
MVHSVPLLQCCKYKNIKVHMHEREKFCSLYVSVSVGHLKNTPHTRFSEINHVYNTLLATDVTLVSLVLKRSNILFTACSSLILFLYIGNCCWRSLWGSYRIGQRGEHANIIFKVKI